jgi:hypothetical protein
LSFWATSATDHLQRNRAIMVAGICYGILRDMKALATAARLVGWISMVFRWLEISHP